MKVEAIIPEVVQIFNEIQKKPEALFEMIRLDLQQIVGEYLTAVMNAELTHFLERLPYERCADKDNHRNGSYSRKYALKGIGNIDVKIPCDRKGEFQIQIIPRSQ
jgi:putative transposase